MITLPADLSTQVASSSSSFLTQLTPILTIIIGVLLAAVVVDIIIGSIRNK